MDWVPFLFIDAVCHQLQSKWYNQVSQLSEQWSTVGAKHDEKRREFRFAWSANDQEVSYLITKRGEEDFSAQVGELDFTYDRITAVTSEHQDHSGKTHVSLDKLQRDVFPTVASLVANCRWHYLNPERSAQSLLFFKAFQNCPGFNQIQLQDHGEETREFVSRQLELANVEIVNIETYTATTWPQPEELCRTLSNFVNSARFRGLFAFVRVPNDFELVELFLARAMAGELMEGACIWVQISFAKSQLGALHREHREDSEKLAWRIPNSNSRVQDAWTVHFGYISLSVDQEKRF